jgi:FkbM family methyltransferase
MDPYWQELIDFQRFNGLDCAHWVAPVQFSGFLEITSSYSNVSAADLDGIDGLILHKGLYRELEPKFVCRALDELHPTFANPVFVLFTRTGPRLEADNPHIGSLAAIRDWAEAAAETPPELNRPRMAATYLGNAKILLESAFGHLMVVPGTDRSITPHLIRDGYFDRTLTDFISKAVKPGSTFIDVGANVGTYSLIAAERVGATGKLVAVEANPRMAQILLDNLEMNGFSSRAEVFAIAAANQNGHGSLYEFSRHEGSHTMVQEVANRAVEEFSEQVTETTVPARKLDDLFSQIELREADLLKIDVEGFELDAILGARSFLRTAAPDLIVEWHPSFMPREAASQLYALLTVELGYAVAKIGSADMQQIGFEELMAIDHSDIYATRGGGISAR